jgi:hypothetical protein
VEVIRRQAFPKVRHIAAKAPLPEQAIRDLVRARRAEIAGA